MLLLNGASTSSKENQATCSVVPASSRRIIGGSTGKCGLPRCRRRSFTLGFLYQYKNPRVKLRRRHRGKPHLPVEPPMIRRDDAGTTLHVAWFSFELVLAPFRRSIGKFGVRSLDHDFKSLARHGAERAVGVDQMQRLEARIHELSARKQIACRADTQ